MLHSLRLSQQPVCGWPMGVASFSELIWSSLELASGSFAGKHNQNFTDSMLNMGLQRSVKQFSSKGFQAGETKSSQSQHVVVDVVSDGDCGRDRGCGLPRHVVLQRGT